MKILKRAIAKAEKNGFKFDSQEFPTQSDFDWYEVWIFNHDFAKAFWKDEEYHNEGHYCKPLPAWQYHLQQMVLEEEPLKYLEKFL